MRAVGPHTRLVAGERISALAEAFDRHRQQGHRDALASGQQHVHLALRRRSGADGLGQVQELIRGVAHRRDHHRDIVSRTLGVDHTLRDSGDGLDVADGGATVLLDKQRHDEEILERSGWVLAVKCMASGSTRRKPVSSPRGLGRARPTAQRSTDVRPRPPPSDAGLPSGIADRRPR